MVSATELRLAEIDVAELRGGKLRLLRRALRLRTEYGPKMKREGVRMLDQVIVCTYADLVRLGEEEQAHIIVAMWRSAYGWCS